MKSDTEHEPFVENHDLTAEVSARGGPPVPVHLRLRRNVTNSEPITAKIFGPKETARTLTILAMAAGPYFTVRTNYPGVGSLNIYSEHAAIQRGPTTTSRYGDDGTLIQDEIATIAFDEVALVRQLDGPDSGDRHVTFMLQGPPSAWGAFTIIQSSFTGDVRAEVRSSHLQLGKAHPFLLRVGPFFFHWSDRKGEQRYTQSTSTYALYFRERKNKATALSDNEFIARATTVANDLVTLASFLSRDRIAWYERSFTNQREYRIDARGLTYRQARKVDFNELQIDPSDRQKFLRTALRRVQLLRKRNVDVTFAIQLYVASFDPSPIEEQLISAFRALENLVYVCDWAKSQRGLLPENEFRKVRKKLEECINAAVPTHTASLMKPKLSELNRPSFRHKLSTVCQKIGVSYLDRLYKAEQQATFVGTRDKLVHGVAINDAELMLKETIRIRTVFERLIMRVLGWTDMSRVPPHHISQWLVEK